MRLKVAPALAVPFLIICLAASSGMAQRGQKQPQTALPPDAPKALPTSLPADATGAGVDPKTYTIGPEDVLNILVWREPELTKNHLVRSDGKVTMPLLGDIQAAGLTPERLKAQITQALSEQILKPEVTVTVMAVNSRKFYISGEVNKAGVFSLAVPVRVFDALNMAASFRDFAKTTDILIIRANGKEILHFNYKDYIKGKHTEKNILLENGDSIIVK
jgi:polysaccharide export outer membrane protein